jgi:hypothetical protein
LDGKHFLEVVKNLEISYYLLIIWNLLLKLLIAIYIYIYIYILFWIFIFQFHLLKFNFYINFGPHFYNCYLFFPYYFFYWNVLCIKFDPHSFDCFEIIYEMLIIIILISSSFKLFLFFRFDLYYFDYYLFYLR